MKLYLVRHGVAVSPDVNPLRPLHAVGIAETQKVATYIKGCNIEIDEIIHSPKLRAKQTAMILEKTVAPDLTLIERESGLSPNDDLVSILEEIKLFDRNVMIVGHLPFMDRLLTTLIYKEEKVSPVNFCPSCIVCLEGEGQNWTISWVISPFLFSV